MRKRKKSTKPSPTKWERIGDEGSGFTYILNEDHCYPGTAVEVIQTDYKTWHFRIANTENEPLTDKELSRKKTSIRSKKSWRTPGTAKKHALTWSRTQRWLELAGIQFKPEDESH